MNINKFFGRFMLSALFIAALAAPGLAQPSDGPYIAQQSAMTLAELEERASNGDAEAQFELGLRYFLGAANLPEAKARSLKETGFALVERAAKQGHIKAQFRLGLCYVTGFGCEKDYLKAAECFKPTAERGNTRSQFYLSLCYLAANDSKAHNSIAYSLLEELSAHNPDAEAVIGYLYLTGLNYIVPRNTEKAEKFIKEACQKNSWMGHLFYAVYLADDKSDGNYSLAMSHLHKAYAAFNQKQDNGAIILLRHTSFIGLALSTAMLTSEGEGFEKDEAQAWEILKGAAECIRKKELRIEQ